MVFSGIPFLYFFLPILLLVYFISPDKMKNPVLLLFSLIFYASGEPKNIIVMLVTVLIAYCAALWFSKLSGKGRKAVFAVSVILSLIPLLYFKYSDFLIINVKMTGRMSTRKNHI